MSNPHSQHLDAIFILWLPRDFWLTQSSVRDDLEVAHIFALRNDFQLPEEIEGFFTLGQATKNSRKLVQLA